MTGSILNKANQVMADRALAGWHRFPNNVDDLVNDLEVAFCAATADQVISTRHAFEKRRA